MFNDVKQQVYNTGMCTPSGTYHTMMGRWAAGIVMSEEIEEYVLNKIRNIFNNQTLVPAYHYTVAYQRKDGCLPNLWNHLDQNGSQISVNIAIENTANWPIIVEGVVFDQQPNDAVIFCGQQHVHGRPPFPGNNDSDKTIQLFMHYSTPEHWIQNKDRGGVGRYGKDGDVRFFNRYRYFPLPDPPVNQPIGRDQDYSSVLSYYNDVAGHAFDVDTEMSEISILSKKELAPGLMLYKTDKNASRTIRGLVQNAMFKQWKQAEIQNVDGSPGINLEARNCFNYFLTSKQNTCHPQDPILRAKKSLELGLDVIVNDFCQRYYVKPLKSRETVLLRYEPGNMFHYHYDDNKGANRVISVSMLLNDDFCGGELEFREFGISLKPETGDVIVFSSSFPYIHQVKKILYGIRYSVVKWYDWA
jgi:hypothetical protein